MSVTALIAEYNPFHNGHLYHLEQSKKITGNDDLIVIMSGNFTQRGDAALLDKWARTKQALSCGADLVIELPLIYNIRSAEYFAYYSILSLEKSKIVDSIVFGSESGDIEIITEIAAVLNNESPEFKKNLQNYLKTGLNFPSSRQKALLKSYQKNIKLQNFSKKEIKKTLSEPNNILGIEYLKALLKLDSKIKAHTLKRKGTAYHSQKIKKNYASASFIRNLFNLKSPNKALAKAEKLMPPAAWNILKNEIEIGRFSRPNSKTKILTKTIDQLRRLTADDLNKYNGISGGLENRFIEKSAAGLKPDSFLESLKSKNLTESKIKRKILQIYFELTTKKIKTVENKAPHYLRILGLKKGKEYLISKLKQKSDLEIIINPASKINSLNLKEEDPLKLSLSFDLLASDLYALLYQNPEHSQSLRDFYQKLIKI